MASSEAWALLQEFWRERVGRRDQPTDDDWAELIDKALAHDDAEDLEDED